MPFVILESKFTYPGGKRLARDPETKNALSFESEAEARSYVETYRKDSNWRIFYPEYEVWEASDLLSSELDEVFSGPFEDDYICPEKWEAVAYAVARTQRFDQDAYFDDCIAGVVEGLSTFGLQVLVPYSQVLADLAEVNGKDWWEYLDFSPRYRWVEGDFEAPEDLFGLSDILNWLSEKNGLKHLDLSDLPTFGGEEPEDTQGVFSWDEDLLLVQGPSAFEVVTREEWADK